MTKPRLLFVDDEPANKGRLIHSLVELGVPRDNIIVARTALEARRELQNGYFDLMILDLALPNREEDEPVRDGGVTLLKDMLARRNRFHIPKYIVGLTAYQDLKHDLTSTFDEHLWPLLQYDPSDDGWLARILNQVRHIMSIQERTATIEHQTDVCIVTALYEPELTEILKLQWDWDDALPLDDATLYHQGEIQLEGRRFSVIAASARRMGAVASALTAMKLIHHFRPRLLVMPGICAGVRGKSKFGDVILASTVWDWQTGKLSTDDGNSAFSSDPHQIHAPDIVTSRFEHIAARKELWHKIYESYYGTKPDHFIGAHTGPVATSSSVLADPAAVSQIQEQNRKLMGIEMEGYGVYAAALWVDEPKPLAFALKSVCDFGDETKDDRYQHYAAYTSASATELFLRKLLPEL